MIEKSDNRDYRIELLRFIATMGIAIFHFEWIYLGKPVYFQHFYLWVEFFFVLSGFFLARNVEKGSRENEMESLQYTLRQAKKMYPAYIVGFIFSFIVYCMANQVKGLWRILKLIWSAKWEMFYFHLFGIDPTAPNINAVTAYIPALLIASLVLHYLLCNYKKITVNIIVILVPIAGYSHIVNLYGNLSQWTAYENWYTVGILRALAGMSVGILAYNMSNCMKIVKKGGIILTTGSLLMILGLVLFRNSISYYDEVIYPYVFGICIGSIYARKIEDSKVFWKKVIIYFGRISLNIYMLHYGVCYLMRICCPEINYRSIAGIYLLLVIIFAIVVEAFLKKTKRLNKVVL